MANSESVVAAVPVRTPPSFYNDLDASLAHAWALIGRGVADRRCAFHTPVIATVDETGAPCQRVMVLRAADAVTRSLRVHTDVRSEKLAHIGQNPRVSLAFYDAGAKLQLRLSARAEVHKLDRIADEAWLKSRPQSRLCYEQAVAPGAPVETPLPELPVDERAARADDGRPNFAVLIMVVDHIEWLYLAIEGHRRARWTWQDDRWLGTWLAP